MSDRKDVPCAVTGDPETVVRRGLDVAALLVDEFHKHIGRPLIRDEEGQRHEALRLLLILEEEVAEMRQEIEDGQRGRLPNELSDVLYATLGLAAVYGMPAGQAFEIIHRANMTKQPPARDSDKAWKGEGFTDPDLSALVPAAADAEASNALRRRASASGNEQTRQV